MEEEEEREKEEETQEEGRGEREREILIGKMRSWIMGQETDFLVTPHPGAGVLSPSSRRGMR